MCCAKVPGIMGRMTRGLRAVTEVSAPEHRAAAPGRVACRRAGRGRARERHEKERFYRGQQSTTRGFMGMALQALSVLTRLAADPAIKARAPPARPRS